MKVPAGGLGDLAAAATALEVSLAGATERSFEGWGVEATLIPLTGEETPEVPAAKRWPTPLSGGLPFPSKEVEAGDLEGVCPTAVFRGVKETGPADMDVAAGGIVGATPAGGPEAEIERGFSAPPLAAAKREVGVDGI